MSRRRLARSASAGGCLGTALVLALVGCVSPKPIGSIQSPGTASRKPPPIATRELNVASDCSFRDPTGYRGTLKLDVAGAQVQAFEARVDVPDRGFCQFDLRDFEQTARLPNVVLRARGSACTVHMWEQGHRVTVAFNDCADRCSAGAYPYLWPILADARSKRCG
jgi:hypothetical protein